jgi:Flp pilus assembly pilin Flp
VALMQLLAWLPTMVRRDEEAGQGGLEYALVAGVVVVAIIIAFQQFPVGEIVTAGLTKVQDLVGGS